MRGFTIFINLFDWSQSFDTFGGLQIGHFHDLKVSMILNKGKLSKLVGF